MAAAEALALEPLAHTSVDVIFFSAEENGLIGSEQYVKEHRSDLKGTVVLNLDMVGSGERMTYVTGAGMFPPRRTSARLNAILRHAWPGMRGRWYWMGSSDFASFLAKKIPAASLEASGKGRENVYHTDRDTMDFIETDLLDEAARIVLDFAAAVDGAND
jgi:Zn-dependent M28 family amino/carboxypeptidase